MAIFICQFQNSLSTNIRCVAMSFELSNIGCRFMFCCVIRGYIRFVYYILIPISFGHLTFRFHLWMFHFQKHEAILKIQRLNALLFLILCGANCYLHVDGDLPSISM